MRRIRYQVACSLDGYIAGPNGEADWIIMDPDIDFEALFRQFDTLFMGRRTFESLGPGGGGTFGMRCVVFSRTLRPEDHPGITIISDQVVDRVGEIRAQPGKDIWLFGGGELFRSLLELGCVDTIEPAVIPVLLGGGIPLLPSHGVRSPLALTGQRTFNSGIVLLEYAIKRQTTRRRARRRSEAQQH